MIFGIKTKKDKKIEQLQAEVERLSIVYSRPHIFKVDKHSIDTWVADFCVNFEDLENVPDGYVKRVLTNKMLEVVENNIVVEHTEDYQRRCVYYKAKLKVVRDK